MVKDCKIDLSKRIILDLCAGTGAWSAPYANAGYTVRQYDLKNDDDIRLIKKTNERIYGILCAPPCTNFSLAKHNFYGVTEKELLEGLSVVDACIRIIFTEKPYFWALENPCGRLRDYLGAPKFVFQPYEYGDGWTKPTCLWGKFKIPKKSPVPVTQPRKIANLYHHDASEKAARRAITPPGFAKAFFEANQ